jgi:hypothetical protein
MNIYTPRIFYRTKYEAREKQFQTKVTSIEKDNASLRDELTQSVSELTQVKLALFVFASLSKGFLVVGFNMTQCYDSNVFCFSVEIVTAFQDGEVIGGNTERVRQLKAVLHPLQEPGKIDRTSSFLPMQLYEWAPCDRNSG